MIEARNDPLNALEKIRKRDFPSIPPDLVREILEIQKSSKDESAVVRKMADAVNRYVEEGP